MNPTIKYLLSILAMLALLQCTHDHAHDHAHDDHDHDEMEDHQEEEEEHHENEVGLTTLQMQNIGLQMGQLEQKNLKSTIKVNGELELPPQNKAHISAIAEGKITQIHVQPGQYVKKGAKLATLLNPALIDWQQSFLETEASLNYLNKEWARQKELVAKEIAPQKNLDKISAERTIAQAKLKGLQSKLQLVGIGTPSSELTSHIFIRSPINGFVRNINVTTGAYIQPESTLFEIVDNHHLHIDLKVFEKDLPYIQKGQRIQFSLQSKPAEPMEAKIFAIGKALDAAQRTVNVHAEIIDEKTELLPGMFVEARILIDDKKVAALPDEAITTDKGLYYIFVKEDEHDGETHFKKIPVLTGVSDFGYTEVTPLEELAANAAIVTESAYFLMAQSKKGEEGAGHHHH